MPELLKLRGISLADQAKEQIRGAIISGSIKSGDRIGIEDTARRLGISRTPVREALSALENEGMVTILRHRGAVVNPLVREEFKTRYTITAMLEGYAAELACQRNGAEIAEQLERNCNEMRICLEQFVPTDSNIDRLHALNMEFHQIIWDGSGSTTLVRMLTMMRQPRSYSNFYWHEPESRAATMAIHEAIVGAFKNLDAALARRLCEQHMHQARERMARD